MNYLDFPLEIKKIAEDGTFSGYASLWDVTDLQNDVVRRGAFKEIIRNDDGRVVFLWQHDERSPIGTASVAEDAKGLHFESKLILADPVAQKAYAHMKAKSVRGVSIGYDTIEANRLADGRRELISVRLWECSLVTFPALPQAQVQTVKSLVACSDVRELKHLLRERDGLSRSKAAASAEALWRIIHGEAAPDDEDEIEALRKATGAAFAATQQNIKTLAAELQSITKLISPGKGAL